MEQIYKKADIIATVTRSRKAQIVCNTKTCNKENCALRTKHTCMIVGLTRKQRKEFANLIVDNIRYPAPFKAVETARNAVLRQYLKISPNYN